MATYSLGSVKNRILTVIFLVAFGTPAATAQIFQDNLAGETIGGFPSQWDIVGGLAAVKDTAEGKIISFPPSAGTIMPLVNGEDNNYLPENFTIEFDAFFDTSSSLYGQALSIRLWPGAYGFQDGDIRYKPFMIYRDGLETDWNHPTPGNSKNHIPELQTLESVSRHVSVELNNGSLKVTMDGHLVFMLPRFKMQPTMVSIGGAVNDSQFEATTGFTNFVIHDGQAPAVNGSLSDAGRTESGVGAATTGAVGPEATSLPQAGPVVTGGMLEEAMAGNEVGDGESETRPSGPVVRDINGAETEADLSGNILSEAIAADDSLGETAQTQENGSENSQSSQTNRRVALGYSGYIKQFSELSGVEGSYTHLVEFSGSQSFPYQIYTDEVVDKPCRVEIKAARGLLSEEGDFVIVESQNTSVENCDENTGPHLGTFAAAFEPDAARNAGIRDYPSTGVLKPITAIQACLNANLAITPRVKGIRARVQAVTYPSGNRATGYDTPTFMERTNCGSWQPMVSCPAQTFAIGFILHFRDGSTFTPKDYLSGIQLVCTAADNIE